MDLKINIILIDNYLGDTSYNIQGGKLETKERLIYNSYIDFEMNAKSYGCISNLANSTEEFEKIINDIKNMKYTNVTIVKSNPYIYFSTTQNYL